MNKVVISILGQDQPGILAAAARVIHARGANIENLSQTLLQSVFGALLLVSLPPGESAEALQTALGEACAELGLVVSVHPYQAPAENQEEGGRKRDPRKDVQPYIVTAMGPDRQGLVAEVATQLAAHDVNITNMQAIFKGGDKPLDNLMIFEVDVPRHTVMNDLRAALQDISSRLALEISVQHRKIFESVSNIQA